MAKKCNVELNTKELKLYLTHMVENNRYLQSKGIMPIAINVEGESGIGKTASIIQLSKELNIPNFVKINLAQIEELGDLSGFVLRQFQMCKSSPPKTTNQQVMEGGKMVMKQIVTVESDATECLWVDEHAVSEYAKQGFMFTGQKRMSYCAPEWIADKGEGGFFFIDDFSRGSERFQQAIMEIVDKQEYISWKLPKDWHVILSSNPDSSDYQVTTLDLAQETRMAKVLLKFDIDCWAERAELDGVDGRGLNFLLLNPELVTREVNARCITNFFNSISSFKDFESNLPMIQMIGEGSVGPEFATMFTLFINNKLDKLISPKDILFHESEIHVLRELQNCIGTGKNYRADIASILVTRVINTATQFAEHNTIEQETINRLITLATDQNTLTDDLKYVLIKKIVNANKQKFSKLLVDPRVVKIAVK